jgi:hypothetical protein
MAGGKARSLKTRTRGAPLTCNRTRPRVQGFFVAKMSLHNPDPAISESNPAKYADATRIPYIVFTSAFYKEQGTGHLGDFAFVVSDAAYSWAILADTGGKHIGEISMFLASKLSGKPTNPRNDEGAPRAPLRFVVFRELRGI